MAETYRMKTLDEHEVELKLERDARLKLSKSYSTGKKVFQGIDTALTVAVVGVSGSGLLATLLTGLLPVGVVFQGVAVGIGMIKLLNKMVTKRCTLSSKNI